MNKERYGDKLEKIKEAGNYRELRAMQLNGFLVHHDGREMLNLSSNDYLGLASDPALREDFRRETDVQALGYSAASSRLLSGNHEYYTLLEDDLREMYDKEAALVLGSGYHANIGIIPALAGKRDLIVSDKLVHASIIDGARLAEADMARYRHLDYEHLREILSRQREMYENVFIVTESVFSMDGDVADLQQLCDIKQEYDALLYVDEAHAVGARGTNGLGCCEEQGCIADIDFIVGTFGKALASYGAFLVCDALFKEFLVNTQRSLIFSTALPPLNVAWTRFVLRRVPDLFPGRLRLADMAGRLRDALAKKGFETRGASHVVPCLCGSNENSSFLSRQFRDNGFFVLPVRYPTVPKNEARLRFSLNAAIPDEDYDCLFEFIEVSC
ncbi:MAG: 8-amino-7-oxononanoate synthase [Odoribacteraceae bacterium]|jgi:8-amino-7-oxononanoate synthase|nr:8-amino-7-oxononanoate synthase [Odoribacteraceae bacterium]